MLNQALSFLQQAQFEKGGSNSSPLLDEFVQQMDFGLKGNAQSLAMLPAHISPHDKILLNKPVIVLDAGGTHLRVALARFTSTGNIEFLHSSKFPMPGRDKEISAVEFYDTLCDHLSEIIHKTDQIGFCFSYPCEINANKDGKLLYWTKEIKAPAVEGQWIGQELLHHIKRRFNQDKKIVLLNDTVATLLAGKSLHTTDTFDSYIGLILGTGTNCAYSENNSRIEPLAAGVGQQIINIESGNFNGGTLSLFDRQLDQTTDNPGTYLLEKRIGGQYLGGLLAIMLRNASDHSILGESDAKRIKAVDKIETSDLSDILNYPVLKQQQLPHWYNGLSKQGQLDTFTFAQAIRDRAAWLTAVNIAGGVVKSLGILGILGIDHTPLLPCPTVKSCLITVDGSTYYKTPELKIKVEKHLCNYFSGSNIELNFCQVHDAPLVGACPLCQPGLIQRCFEIT